MNPVLGALSPCFAITKLYTFHVKEKPGSDFPVIGTEKSNMFRCSMFCLVSIFMQGIPGTRAGALMIDSDAGQKRLFQKYFTTMWGVAVHRARCLQFYVRIPGARWRAAAAAGSDQESGNHQCSTSPPQFRWNLSLNRNSKCPSLDSQSVHAWGCKRIFFTFFSFRERL